MKLAKCLILLFLLVDVIQAQVLHPSWKRSVIVVDQRVNTNFSPVGTAFCVRFRGTPYVVTNRHVAEIPSLFFRFNSKLSSGTVIRFSVDSIRASSGLDWALSNEGDLAALPLLLYDDILTHADSLDIATIGVSLFKGWDYLNEGDDLFILGFPLQLGAGLKSHPVYRSGIIALKDKPGQFLIDANIYPGNSGGPVFLRPSFIDYRQKSIGTMTLAYFVGVVSAYVPYIDVAISSQTRRPRITFEENSGLAIVYSSDLLAKLLEEYGAIHKLHD